MLRMKPKTAAIGIAAITLGVAVAAAADKQPISWWYENANPEQRKILAETLVDPFNAAHPSEELRIDYRGSEFDKQIRVALLSGGGPDVVYTAGPSYVAVMAQAGQLLPLDDYAKKFGWNDRILPLFLKIGSYDGKLYSLPKTYETMGLFYNKTLFDQNGWQPPKTLADIDKLAAEMKAKGITPFAGGNAQWRPTNEHYVTIAFNHIAGPEKVYQALKGEIPWTDPAFVKAVDELTKWFQEGYFGDNYFSLTGEQTFAQLAQGKAGMAPTGTWAFQWVAPYFGPSGNEVGFVPFPSAEGVPSPLYSLGIGSTFSINKNAKNPEGAAEVINAVFDPGFYERISAGWAGEWNIPLKDLSNVDLAKAGSPAFADAMVSLADAVSKGQYGYTTWTFWPPATEQYLINGIEEVWLNKIGSADYLAKLDQTFQGELKDGKVPPVPERD